MDLSDQRVTRLNHVNLRKRPPPPLFYGRGHISDTAMETCEIIIQGFQMITSQNVLLNGYPNMDYYDHTLNAETIKKELIDNSQYWMSDKTSVMFSLFKTLEGLLDAVINKDVNEIFKIYYRAQHHHTLDNTAPFPVPIYLEQFLCYNWIVCISSAIMSINTAAPGLNLYLTSNEQESKICIGNNLIFPTMAYTQHTPRKAYIWLGVNFQGDWMGTAIHELLHALGFQHEMQRWDADLYLNFNVQKDDMYAEQYSKNFQQGALTRFDPFSIMMYPENATMTRRIADPIWNLKPSLSQPQVLSELNKVALNLLYKPCKSLMYNPTVSAQTVMLYCGRPVMSTHNQCGPPIKDNNCGPFDGANCPACRVIIAMNCDNMSLVHLHKIKHLIGQNKWQGLSGFFYCGKRYSIPFYCSIKGKVMYNNGICGGDNGLPCNDCGKEMQLNYSLELFKPFQFVTGAIYI